jgi:tRNA A37 threonylcarbamoyladenosine biosynthesis protein TsaE
VSHFFTWLHCCFVLNTQLTSLLIATLYLLQTNSDFDAKPMVMLLGQYSTGKTTFIKHLLKCGYPGK